MVNGLELSGYMMLIDSYEINHFAVCYLLVDKNVVNLLILFYSLNERKDCWNCKLLFKCTNLVQTESIPMVVQVRIVVEWDGGVEVLGQWSVRIRRVRGLTMEQYYAFLQYPPCPNRECSNGWTGPACSGVGRWRRNSGPEDCSDRTCWVRPTVGTGLRVRRSLPSLVWSIRKATLQISNRVEKETVEWHSCQEKKNLKMSL